VPISAWINIIMTDAEREEAGIAVALKKPRHGTLAYDGQTEFR
jgi:hypothetical protein